MFPVNRHMHSLKHSNPVSNSRPRLESSKLSASALVLVLLVTLALPGCKSPLVTKPKRSAIEQLLLSTAVDNALDDVDIPEVAGKRVYISEDYLDSYDSLYVMGSIRAVMSENDALLVNSEDEADIIVEARSGALGIDSSTSLVGLPSIPIVIPGAGSLELPTVALYQAKRADSVTKLSFLAYEADTGTRVHSGDAMTGKSKFHNYTFLFFLDVNFTDVPEREGF